MCIIVAKRSPVQPGATLDGVSTHLKLTYPQSSASTVEAEILVAYRLHLLATWVILEQPFFVESLAAHNLRVHMTLQSFLRLDSPISTF
jgi:hypothetical protein